MDLFPVKFPLTTQNIVVRILLLLIFSGGEEKMELGQLTQNAMTVLKKRYLQKDPQGNIVETPEELFRRVAKNIAQADRFYHPEIDLGMIEPVRLGNVLCHAPKKLFRCFHNISLWVF